MKKYTITQRFDSGLLRGHAIKSQTNVMFTLYRQYNVPPNRCGLLGAITGSRYTIIAMKLNRKKEVIS